jgi:cell wall-associated NlpC family hydrolase
MYMDRFRKNNFHVLDCHPSEYQIGDVFLMSIMSTSVNHAGILVDKGKMLHHLVNQLSTVTPYKGLWRNNTMAVVRHRDVKAVSNQTEVNILDFVPPSVRRKIDEHLRQTQTDPS